MDVIINRTLVYGLLTALQAAGYFGSIVFNVPFRALTGQDSQLASVAATLAMAALSNPLRRRIQGFIDRSSYRRKLRNETDLDALRDDLIGVVRETMQPAHVGLWLRPDLGSRESRSSEDQRG